MVVVKLNGVVGKARGRNGLTLAVQELDFALETVGAGRHDDFGIKIDQRAVGERTRRGCTTRFTPKT